MGNPRDVRVDEVEIVVARELRKAGIPLAGLRSLERRLHAPGDPSEYTVRLVATSAEHPIERQTVIEFRNQQPPIGPDAVRALAERESGEPPRDAPVRLIPAPGDVPDGARAPAIRVLFSTSGYHPDAVREAKSLGVVLLAIADGPAAFRRSQWSMGQTTPAWVPEYIAEVVSLGPDGTERREMLAGQKLV